MDASATSIFQNFIELLQVLIWPAVVCLIVARFGRSASRFIEDLGEFTFKAGGVEATGKRAQIEAAALLGAATATRAVSSDGEPEEVRRANASEIADLVSDYEQSKHRFNRTRFSVLWVDDRPSNNVYEREALEMLRGKVTTSTSTEEL